MKNLTQPQKDFIEKLTALMTTQDIRGTQFPLFYIYEKEEVRDEENASRWAYFPTDGDWDEISEYTIDEGDEDEVYKLDEERDMWVLTSVGDREVIPDNYETEIDGYDFIDRDGVKLTRMGLKEINKPVLDTGPFLTEAAANAHITANNYHYNKPFTYVNSAWRNYELQEVLKLLFILADKEVPAWYK